MERAWEKPRTLHVEQIALGIPEVFDRRVLMLASVVFLIVPAQSTER